jgi:hypothetical protein
MPSGTLATPRPAPNRRIPAVGGTAVIALALPVFLIAGWPVAAWGIAAGLWVFFQGVGLVLERLPVGMDNLPSSGVVALGRMFRTVALGVILVVLVVSDSSLGVPAAAVYVLAFTVEFGLSLAVYFGGEAGA